ncbi:MAG: M67 family metallopeptidase [Thermoleophilia bacterium]
MSDALRLSPDQYQSIIDHARSCQPEEACGILAGEADGVARKVFLMENTEHSDVFYMMDSREQFEVFDAIERDGLKLLAIFHSHPHSPPLPSAQDMELAFYPDAFYLIVSLMREEPEARVFRIVDGEVREAELALGGDR